MKLDSLDRAILKHLQDDARLSLRELGRKLNTPHTTVFTRVNKLVKNDIIKDFSAILHPHDLGFKVSLLKVEAPIHRSLELENAISSCTDVMKVYKLDEGKVIVKAVSHDGEPTCVSDIRSRISDVKIESYLVKDILKYDHRLHADFIDAID